MTKVVEEVKIQLMDDGGLYIVKNGQEGELADYNTIDYFLAAGYVPSDTKATFVMQQGRFVWFEEYETDFDDESYLVKSGFRPDGVPVKFSEVLEDYLFWYQGSALELVECINGVFQATIRKQDGETIVIRC
ncbi:hypothetical protein F4V43_02350 [Paenibacillus spiritus]|uniref:Uncharacterized protein n=1 Tax=Paenibacillus spiritus TaxID=2496557 RepID=A0A5J5GGY1_9BACL|nr:hypothetical protein [Paenibacillus spiritus]KAA9007347.1 hypothetical protein F4V43_02350 [Paenibacillus spiritus]